ncbi:MAG: ClpXP protease specificity-enhancing factor SspB [Micropepsaceae bacterium]
MSSKDWIGYQALADNAQRSAQQSIVRDALRHVARGGMMGNHHFYITYDTRAPGVVISDVMKSQYPEMITIVIQHQFFDLKVMDDAFEVGLSFNKMPEVLRVPYNAIRQFADPSQSFGFAINPPNGQPTASRQPAETPKVEPPKPKDEPPKDDKPTDPTVVSLDRFRKK